MKLLFVSARSATVLLNGEGDYTMPSPAVLTLNGISLGEENRAPEARIPSDDALEEAVNAFSLRGIPARRT